MGGAYADIIDQHRPVHDGDTFSRVHPRMSLLNRAKIFTPFAALRGYDEAVAAKEIQYVPKLILDSDDNYEINRRLNIIYEKCWCERLAKENAVTVSVGYYVPCTDKNSDAYDRAGLYKVATGIVHRIDVPEQYIIVGDEEIRFEDIAEINDPKGELFEWPEEQDDVH